MKKSKFSEQQIAFILRQAPTGRNGKKGDRDHCLGRSRGGLTTKSMRLSTDKASDQAEPDAGQSHDAQAADKLLDHVGGGTIVLAGKAYDADRIRTSLRERGRSPIFRPKTTGSQSRTSAHGFTVSETSSSASSPS